MKSLFKLLVLLGVLYCLFVSACGNEEKVEETPAPAQTVSEPAVPAPTQPAIADIDKHIAEAIKGVDKNTSATVDTIAKLAKNDAKQINELDVKQALDYIRKVHPNYYTDNETMEKAMYYGYLLDYAFDDNDPRSHVGFNVVKSIKYVYRGAEKTTDEATTNNLEKVKKELAKIK